MFQIIKFFQFGIISLILSGCEYNLTKENFVDVEQPSSTRNLDLKIVPFGDTLEIFEETELSYSIETYGQNVLFATMTLQGNTQDISYSHSFTIDPSDYTPGIDTLTLNIITNSGSGSIADFSGMEGYSIEKKWIVKIDGRAAPIIIPTKRINEEGFLVIEWPKCERYNFVSYEINANSGLIINNRTITDVNHNYYVDSMYVGGDFYIRVSCRVVNDHTWGEALKFYEEPPQLNVEEIGWDSLKISWNKSPYKAKYTLNSSKTDPLYFNASEDTMCIIPQIGFGNWVDFYLCAKSQYYKESSYNSYVCNASSSVRYFMGELLIGANYPEFGYNYTDKVLYSNEYNQLKCFDILDCSVINSVDVPQLIPGGEYSCPTNSSKVATTTQYNIYVFENENLESPTIIRYKTWGSWGIDHFLLTDNDIIAFTSHSIYKLIDVNSKQTIDSISISNYPVYSPWACISTSQNAKYMCIATNNGIRIYTLNDDKLEESFSDNRDYSSAYFNPYNPNQLYLTLNEEAGIEIRNPSNFQLLDKIDIDPEMVIQNIDPETNNLLITDYEYLHVISTETHEVLFRVPCDEYKCWLFNNHIFTNSGFVLDVSECL